ncbi:MAG: ABC transporter ATP-binding protein [Chloroflexota bacterium]
MQDGILTLHRVSKAFGQGKNAINAVQDVSLTVRAGEIYGFLGPNGSGKSTTIRIILSLIQPMSGYVELFGTPIHHNRMPLNRVGSLFEGGIFYPFLSGRDNLAVLMKTQGQYDSQRIDHLLDQTGIMHAANRRVSGYSTGMRQRLGIAAALLNHPDLIILDEPTNGLDPVGIGEIRQIIRSLRDEGGKTVFLSSHLLSEVEQICDRVGFIRNGTLVEETSIKSLLQQEGQLVIEAEPLDQAQSLLSEFAPKRENVRLYLTASREHVPLIVQRLVAHQINIFHIAHQQQRLEDAFLEITREGSHHHASVSR